MTYDLPQFLELFEEIEVSCLVPIHKQRNGWISLVCLTDCANARQLSIEIEEIRDRLVALERIILGEQSGFSHSIMEEYVAFYELYVRNVIALARISDQLEMEFGENLPTSELYRMTKVITIDWYLCFCPLEDVIWLDPLRCKDLAIDAFFSRLN